MAKLFTNEDRQEFLKIKEWCINHPIEAAMKIQELTDLVSNLENEIQKLKK